LRSELLMLVADPNRDHWKVSIIVPLQKGSSHAQANRVRIKNAYKQAIEKIKSTVSDPIQQQKLLEIANEQKENSEFHNGGGIYVSYFSMEASYRFQFPLQTKEKVVVDLSFEVRDILYVLNRTPEYHLFLISQQTPRLYYGIGETLYPIYQHQLISFQDLYPDLEKPSIQFYSAHIGGYDTGVKQKERIRAYITRLANIVYDLLNEMPQIPLFVLGSEKYLGLIKETQLSKLVAEYIAGIYEQMSESELCSLVYPHVLEYHKTQRYQFLQTKLREAISTGKASLGLSEVWAAAIEHKIRILGVEEDFIQPALVNQQNPYEVLPASEKEAKEGYEYHEDIVDDIVEMVLREKGEVIFFKMDELLMHNRIVSISRY